MLSLVFRYLRSEWRALAATFLVAAAARLLLLGDPQVLRLLVDRYVMRAAHVPRPEFVRGVIVLIAAAVALGLLARTLRTLQYWITLISRRVGARFYATGVAQSLALPYPELEAQRSGELLHNIQRARLEAETAIGGTVQLYLGAIAVTAVTAYAFSVHPLIGTMHLVGVPLVGGLTYAISIPIRRRQREIARKAGDLAGAATETLRNAGLVKSLGAEAQELTRLDSVNARILGLERDKARLVRRFTMLAGVLFHGARALLLFTMLALLYDGAISTGQFLTLFLYSSTVLAPLAEASTAVTRYQETRATFDTLDVIAGPPGGDVGRLDPGPVQTLTFEDVSLAYAAGHAPAVRELTLTLTRGETVALAGPSGAGKSSIVKLLLGLHRPTTGVVRVNGYDLSGVDLGGFRQRVSVVAQDTQLFAGSIRENLLLAKPDATDEECRRAVAQASAGGLIERGHEGLDSRIGEGGLTLSGGERQRLSIARALLRDPDVLVFDEATNSLDALTEAAVSETIRRVPAGSRITLLVAHRLATVAHADRIFVLSGGALVESGTHLELLAGGGLYAALWHEQHRGEGATMLAREG